MFLLSARTIRTTCIRLTLSSDSHQGRGRSCRSEACRCRVEASGRPWFDSESVDGDFGPRPQSSRPAAIAASVQTLVQTAGVSRFRQNATAIHFTGRTERQKVRLRDVGRLERNGARAARTSPRGSCRQPLGRTARAPTNLDAPHTRLLRFRGVGPGREGDL